jgi:hypothetical protein
MASLCRCRWLRKQVREQRDALRDLFRQPRQLAFQGLNLAMIVFSALMMWKGLMFLTHSESPVVVVLSVMTSLAAVNKNWFPENANKSKSSRI